MPVFETPAILNVKDFQCYPNYSNWGGHIKKKEQLDQPSDQGMNRDGQHLRGGFSGLLF